MQTKTSLDELTEALEDGVRTLSAALREAQEARRGHDLHEVLTHVTHALEDVKEAERQAVTTWNRWGATWTEIGEFYGHSRQAAWERFGKRSGS